MKPGESNVVWDLFSLGADKGEENAITKQDIESARDSWRTHAPEEARNLFDAQVRSEEKD